MDCSHGSLWARGVSVGYIWAVRFGQSPKIPLLAFSGTGQPVDLKSCEPTALGECASIDIEEKYKIIFLKATKRKILKTNNTDGLDWDINELNQ
jgi:hypothetical protein